MFRLNYAPTGGGDWQVAAGRLISAGGWIEPFNHPMVEARAARDPSGRLGLAVFERSHPGSAASAAQRGPETGALAQDGNAFRQLREEVSRWPLHWFWIEIAAGEVAIEASALPTAPVFVAESRLTAIADWDPLNLYRVIDPVLDEDVAAHYLASFEQPYGPRTVIRQIGHVAAGYRATWRQGRGWTFVPPQSAPLPYPRALEAAADPVRSLGHLLDAALARLVPDPAVNVAAGLSGGLDSTAVAATAARRGHRTATFGLIMPGAEGVAQQARRQAAITLLDLDDHPHAASAGPLGSGDYGRATADRMVPWEELHYDLFDHLYARAAALGHPVFLSGFGGDELLLPYWDELPDRDLALAAPPGPRDLPDFLPARVRNGRQDRAEALMALPTAYAQASVMDAVAGAASQHMRNGLWPVHPLAAPDVVRYCHGLPRHWREGRRLMRELLRRRGLPPGVADPGAGETFTEASAVALTNCPISRGPLRTPRLADLGLIEPTAVAPAYHGWRAGAAPPAWDVHFIAMTVLEATLRSIENARATTPAPARAANPPHVCHGFAQDNVSRPTTTRQ